MWIARWGRNVFGVEAGFAAASKWLHAKEEENAVCL